MAFWKVFSLLFRAAVQLFAFLFIGLPRMIGGLLWPTGPAGAQWALGMVPIVLTDVIVSALAR